VLKSFPHIEDQIRWVYFASADYNLARVDIPGNPQREGGPHVVGALGGAMPAFGSSAGGSLTDAEILAVVCHERYTLGGADPSGDFADEFTTWCSEGSEIYGALESGTPLATLNADFPDIIPIGDAPVPGSPG
jgi:hypothetical protein